MNDQGGATGGGSTNICNVSPSDQIGTISNILNRLQSLEAAISILLGTNVEALQLSDISDSLGWIHNVTYLGTEGWTQTPTGTLIPPPGWSGLSDIIDGLPVGTMTSGSGLQAAIILEAYQSNYASWMGDNVNWDIEKASRGSGVFTWPYGGNADQVRLEKAGWYLCFCQLKASQVTAEIFGANISAFLNKDAIGYVSTSEDSGVASVSMSVLGYTSIARTLTVPFVYGNNNMDVEGYLQLGYQGG